MSHLRLGDKELLPSMLPADCHLLGLHGLVQQAASLEWPTWQGLEGDLRTTAHEELSLANIHRNFKGSLPS